MLYVCVQLLVLFITLSRLISEALRSFFQLLRSFIGRWKDTFLIYISSECSAQGQVLHCKRRSLGCSSAEGSSSTANSGTNAAVYQGLNGCFLHIGLQGGRELSAIIVTEDYLSYKEPKSPYNFFLILIFNELFKFKTLDERQHWKIASPSLNYKGNNL